MGFFHVQSLFAQTETNADSTLAPISGDTAYAPVSSDFVFKPTLGLGTGMFTFFGDVSLNNKGFHPFVSRIGFDLTVTNPLTNWLDLSFYVIFGKISANERSLTRNLNFESRIRTGGAVLTYNFRHIIPEKHKVQPYFFTGFESFEFLSKTDLYDQHGNFYNYWSDGSIRSLAEDDPNAANAVIIHRDYTYESDLREQNIDGFGKYRERSWSLPVGVGFQILMGERLKFRMGLSMHFTFTDMVDNISHESIGTRAGNAANDKFLYSSFSIAYDLMPIRTDKSERRPKYEDDFDDDGYYVQDLTDLDKDGVRDFDDLCLNTPEGIPVDANGCPLDKDKDLVYDHEDDERPTPNGNVVDEKGVTLTDEDIYQRYLRYKDSTGEYTGREMQLEVIGGGTDRTTVNVNTKLNLKYYVIMGSEKKQIASNELYKYLGFKDFKTIEKGDTVYYVLGNYTSVADAMKREEDLKNNGFDPKGIVQENKNNKNINPLNDKEIKTILEDEKNNPDKNITPVNNTNPVAGQPVFRVQIGAYNKRISSNVFKDVPDLVYVTGDDGITRYYSGYFTDLTQVTKHQIGMYEKGHKHAFVTAFKDGKRVSLTDAGATLVDPGNTDQQNNEVINKVDPDLVKFSVNLGEFSGDIPADLLDVFLELGDVLPRSGTPGKTLYITGSFSTLEEAEALRKKVAGLGVPNALVVGEFNGRLITADEAQTLLGK